MNVRGLIREETCASVSPSDTVALHSRSLRTDYIKAARARRSRSPQVRASVFHSLHQHYRGTRCTYEPQFLL